MVHRRAFLAGGAFGVVAAILATALLRAAQADDGGSLRLIVACDEAARSRVLDALRPLPVVVYDMRTMERVALEPEHAPVALRDAMQISSGIYTTLDAARTAAGGGAKLDLLGVALGGESNAVLLRVSDPKVAELVEHGLRENPVLAAETVVRGPLMKRSDGLYDCRFDIRPRGAVWPAPGTTIEAGPELLGALRDVFTRNGTELQSISGERIVKAADATTASVTLSFWIADPAALARLAAEVNAVRGLRVTRIDWRLPETDKTTVPLRISLDVSARRGR